MNLDNVLTAADTTAVEAGGESMFSAATKALTFGTVAAAASGLASIYNTGIWYKNKIFGGETEEWDVAETLTKANASLGAYYEDKKAVLDTVGFVAGSFIPGTLALKGLNMMRAGKAVGAFGRVAGFTSLRQEAALSAGLKELATSGPSIFATINANKTAAMAWGVADNVLQAAVFETAAALTMHQSPTLKDENFGDIAWDIAKTSVVGGAIGGGIEALFTQKIFRDATKAVDKSLRQVDSIQALERMGLSVGDEAFSAYDSILALAKGLPPEAKTLDFSYRLNGKVIAEKLNIAGLVDTKLEETLKAGFNRVQAKLAYVSAQDSTIGTPLGKALSKIAKEGLDGGVAPDEIRHKLGEILWGLKRVEGVGVDNIDFAQQVFYFAPGIHIGEGADLSKAITTTKPGTKAQAYRLAGDWAEMKGGTLGIEGTPATLKDAWEAGFDVILNPASRRIEINPGSQILRPVSPKSEDGMVRIVYHPRTHTTSDNAIPTIADVATSQAPLSVNATGVQGGKFTFNFSPNKFNPTADTVELTARHLWANQVTNLRNTTISSQDFSLLDRLVADPTIADATTKIKLPDGTLLSWESIPAFKSWVLERKLEMVNGLFDPAAKTFGIDTRTISYIVNAEPQFVQKAVENNFDLRALAQGTEGFRPLASLAERDNLVLSYERAVMEKSPEFLDGMRDYQARVFTQKQALRTAFETVIPPEVAATFPELDTVAGKAADSTGAGPTGFGSSNADYTDPLRAWSQASGQWVSLAQQTARNAALEPLQPYAAKILTSNSPELGAILTKARRESTMLAIDGNKIVNLSYLDEVENAIKAGKDPAKIKPLIEIEISNETADFLRVYQQGHAQWSDKTNVLRAAQGLPPRLDPRALYMPPVDTKHVPFFAFVRETEGKAFSTGEVSMITARTQDELLKLTEQVKRDHPDLQVIFKGDTKDYFKAKGDYDFQSQMNNPVLDSYLRKKGVLGDFAPTLEPKAVIEDFVRFIGRREDAFVRSAVSVRSAQEFAELRWLSEQYTKVAESKFAFIGKITGKTIDDPFGDYMRLALNVSKKSEYTFWHEANAFVDSLGQRAYQLSEKAFNSAKDGKITWEQANGEMERMGLRGPFTSQESYLVAQAGGEGNLIKSAVAKGNMLLATVGLRLDTANAIVNVLASPLMQAAEVSAIKNSLKNDPEMLAKFTDMLSVSTPDGATKVPTAMKLILGGIKSFTGPAKQDLLTRYKAIGAIKDITSQYHMMLDDLSLLPNMNRTAWAKKVEAWTEKGAVFTGNNFAEDFTRFISADMMRQLTQNVVDAGKMSLKEQDTFIRIFVNRVHGNYVASQRPIAFQGTIGAAISLFQTYQFNLYQQLFRHIENRDAKTIAVMMGLQSGLFGLNGLPMFDAINTHLVGMASINEGHHDAYSSAVRLVDKPLADWAMYGTVSAFPLFSDKWPAFYTRGDLNPRHATLIPTTFADVPIVSVATRAAQAVQGFATQFAAGNGFVDSFLHGLEHHGLSRPLAGMAQALQGESTTSRGSLIAANADFLSVANVTRMLGAKPMDESVALNTRFRLNAYKAYDTERIEKLGVAVKQKLREGNLSEDDLLGFASEYAARGGRIENYNQALQRWMKSATQSDVNVLMNAHRSVYGQRLLEVMGADPLPDYANLEE